jgi:THO complex subunit 4
MKDPADLDSHFVPPLKYDRSGRSSGVAIITYETPEEASRAIARFNGATANGS